MSASPLSLRIEFERLAFAFRAAAELGDVQTCTRVVARQTAIMAELVTLTRSQRDIAYGSRYLLTGRTITAHHPRGDEDQTATLAWIAALDQLEAALGEARASLLPGGPQ